MPRSKEEDFYTEIMHLHFMTYMATPKRKKPCPGGHEIYNFGRPFLGCHYYILTLPDICKGVEKKVFNAFSLYDFYGHTLPQEPLPQGS